ncbi:MAG: LytR C-terminal domain-containing protein [Propionibacteriaceae bacterium]
MSTNAPSSWFHMPQTPREFWDVVKTPLTLLLLLCFICVAGKWGWKNLTAPAPTPPLKPCTTIATEVLSSNQVTVNIYNGSTERGRASGIAANMKASGFIIGTVGNSSERITQTIIRGAANDNPEVKLAAGFFQNPIIEADGRIDHSIDILVGPHNVGEENNNWSGMNQQAPRDIAVAAGSACVPAIATPTATPSS